MRYLLVVNGASNMKLSWEMLNSNEDWVMLLKARAFRSGVLISLHISSFIWNNIKGE